MTDVKLTYTEEDFKKEPNVEGKLLLLFRIVSAQQELLLQQHEKCDKKYVKIRHVLWVSIIFVAFLAGLGMIQMNVVFPALIKNALAAAGM